jgi:hypothetical protein
MGHDHYTNLTKLRAAFVKQRQALVKRILGERAITIEHAELVCCVQWAIDAIDTARRDELRD